MIIIETYYRSDAGEFLPFESQKSFSEEFDLIEGAVEITVDGETLIGTQTWDYVFLLWAYLADMAKRLQSGDSASMRFPDQPIQLDALRTSNGIRLHLHGGHLDRETVVDEAQFLEALCSRGSSFFGTVISKFPAGRESIGIYRNRLDALRESSSRVAHWEERVDGQKAAALQEAERRTGRRLTPEEREKVIFDVAGRRIAFQDVVARATTILGEG
ncbi:hypothetical protein [Streptomyces sp. CT34]|uniref:hypothetical protein n=1 Tax=Streptomyces sp. CT34 TaxID=1553907 RepID=UPI0005BDC03F|nr:hypothetical protein [Streptomyces sp. CT34]